MYTENEKKRLSKATIKLLQKSIKDIKADSTKLVVTLLRLRNFASVAFNDHERCRNLMVLMMSNMWNMFYKELRR